MKFVYISTKALIRLCRCEGFFYIIVVYTAGKILDYMGLKVTKPVLGASDETRLKQVSSATETK